MNRVELEGVLAHELSHIKNYDILVSHARRHHGRRHRARLRRGDPLPVVGRRTPRRRPRRQQPGRRDPRHRRLRPADPGPADRAAHAVRGEPQPGVAGRRLRGASSPVTRPGSSRRSRSCRDDQTVVASGLPSDGPPLDRAADASHARTRASCQAQPPVRHASSTRGADRARSGSCEPVAPRAGGRPRRRRWRSLSPAWPPARRWSDGHAHDHAADAAPELRLHHRTAAPAVDDARRLDRAGHHHAHDRGRAGVAADRPAGRRPGALEAAGPRRQDRQPPAGPAAERSQPGRRRLRGDRRGDHPLLHGLPLGALRPGRARSARRAPPTSTCWPSSTTRCSPGRAATTAW